MKKIFKKLFSVDRIDLIKKNLKKKSYFFGDRSSSWRSFKTAFFKF